MPDKSGMSTLTLYMGTILWTWDKPQIVSVPTGYIFGVIKLLEITDLLAPESNKISV